MTLVTSCQMSLLGLTKGTSAPKIFETSLTSIESVETITLENILLSIAFSITWPIIGFPLKCLIFFFFGMRFDPPRAGIIAKLFIFL